MNVLDVLIPEPGSICVMDRGYLDYERLYPLHQAHSFFGIRSKSHTKQQRIYSSPVDKTTGVRCNPIIKRTNPDSSKAYPDTLRRARYYDRDFHLSDWRNHEKEIASAPQSLQHFASVERDAVRETPHLAIVLRTRYRCTEDRRSGAVSLS